MKRKLLWLVLALSMCTLTGCGAKKSVSQEEEVLEEDSEVEEEVVEEEPEEVVEEEIEYDFPRFIESSSVLNVDGTAYFIGTNQIVTMDVGSGKTDILWQSEGYEKDAYDMESNHGLILGDFLYFVREEYDNSRMQEVYYLDVIGLDGKNYQEIAEFEDGMHIGNIYYIDGMLYVDGNGEDDCFKVDEHGAITESVKRDQIAEYSVIPESYNFVGYNQNGYKRLLAPWARTMGGKLILFDDNYSTVLFDLEKNEEKPLGDTVVSYCESQLLVRNNNDNTDYYGVIDAENGEYRYLMRTADASRIGIIGMDQSYFYYMNTNKDSGSNSYSCTYHMVSLKDGKDKEVFDDSVSEGRLNYNPEYISSAACDGEYIYTITLRDYAAYPMVISLADGEAVIGDKPYYDSGIGEVGTIQSASFEGTNDAGFVLVRSSADVLKVATKYPGAAAINKDMELIIKEAEEYIDDNLEDAEGWFGDSIEEEYSAYTRFTSEMSLKEISYFDGRILSFELDGYDYMGGAHGLPIKPRYTYDVTTGDRIMLSDMLGVSEEEFVDIVVKAYLDMIHEVGEDYYWDNPEETIRMIFDINYTDFLLTDKGLQLIVYPYELASYAQGFQTVYIPYEELGIDVQSIGVIKE